ncbi:NAD(P)-dependent oxidoreductase [Kribbella qitaiheensis]|uniref:NAD(P)-dependent oxidoreductase n=1 Tax=Kribbella qitaiheensis TaxID=1544730 RepID=A0A7G6WXN8_9ACTN|nr:NAD(P)-dependent oxidoreductase [Kribbella qitaiheensis]QNE18753.1 NAD(P)-dependent oxidoreductase [Kribbella qitaiheensis]
MRIFLAGATGVIGRQVIPRLIAEGHQVTGLTRREADTAALRRQGAQAVVADVYDAPGLTKAMIEVQPEVVMHQLTDLSGGNFQANSDIRRRGTRNLVDAALTVGVTRIIAQSIAWAYEPGDDPADESTPLDLGAAAPRLQTVQAVSQLEETVAEAPEWVVLRYGLFYGPGTWYTKGALMDDQLRAGKLVPTTDITSFVHIEDAAAAAVQALAWPTGPVNIVDNEPAAATDWIPTFAASAGAPTPPATTGDRQKWARGATNTHARTHLGWTPQHPTWRTGFNS